MKSLYLDRHPELVAGFRKEAGFAARLSPESANWPQEANSELVKQFPFFSDYSVNPSIEKTADEKGAAFGFLDVSNMTERPEAEHQEMGLPHIRVPIIIEHGQLKPYSVFLNGDKVVPLNEDRVREALFNPNSFDLSTAQPRDPSLVEALQPPQRSGMGMGGDTKTASVSKEAFAHISPEQWKALYQNEGVQKLVQKHGKAQHPEVDNAIIQLAAKMYGYHPKTASVTNLEEYLGLEKESVSKRWLYNTMKNKAKDLRHSAKGRDRLSGFISRQSQKVGKLLPLRGKRPTGNELRLAGNRGAASETAENVLELHRGEKADKLLKKASILEAIAPTLRDSDTEAFISKLHGDKTLQVGFKKISHIITKVFGKTKRASAEERLAYIADNILPTVTTVQRLPGGNFLIKQASNEAFVDGQQAQGQVVPPDTAAADIGMENAKQMQPGQSATAVSAPVSGGGAGQGLSNAKPVDEFGEYKVQDSMGNQIFGWVFPNLMSWDGNFSPMPAMLFTNGSAYAMQEGIEGEMVGKGTNLPQDEPRGDGSFYYVDGGHAFATIPITINSAFPGPDGSPTFHCVDPFGTPVVLTVQPGLAEPQRVTDSEYAIPETWKFMRLNGQTQLAGAKQQDTKTEAKGAKTAAVLFFNGAYNIEGGCGLHKIASSYRYDLDSVGAEFILGLLGVDGIEAKQKVAEARRRGSVKLAGLKTITLLSEKYAQAEKTASVLLSKYPDLRKDLIKEAAAIDDAETIDKVLALNFINPENLMTFVDYIPDLEEASEKLAEMVLYSYLGVQELPEAAVERAMHALEETVQGLKAVAQSEG